MKNRRLVVGWRITFVLSLLIMVPAVRAQIVINEILVSNSSINTDPDYNEAADWVELYNAGTEAVDLLNYSLTDNLGKPSKWFFPAGTVLQAGGYLMVWCDGRDTGLHTNFKLSADGEQIGLYAPEEVPVDTFSFSEQFADISYGRPVDSPSKLSFFMSPTPNKTNTTPAYDGWANQPVILTQGGFYQGPVTVYLTNDLGGTLHYTLDGSEPTEESAIYTAPLLIEQTAVLRARIFQEGKMPGSIITSTFFINEEFQSHGLPVVSISTNAANFWDDEKGIYVQDFKPDWEVPVNIELFENNGSDRAAVNEPAGIKINALYAWQLPQKMLGVYFRKKYGSGKLSYQLFFDSHRNTFDNFALRASGSDWSYTLFRDGLLQQACRKGEMNLDLMDFRPCAVYVNGEFLGIHNIREKVDDDYVASNYGQESSTFDMVEGGDYAECGDLTAFNQLVELYSQDLSVQSNYDALAEVFDIENFTDYLIAEIFSYNTSLSHNTMVWKPKTGGKWRWILMDADRGFFKYGSQGISYDVDQSCWPLKQLFKNADFKQYFLVRLADHLFTTFNAADMVQQINQHQQEIAPLMERHINRWLSTTSSYGDAMPSLAYWENEVAYLRDYCQGRPMVLLNDLSQSYGFAKPDYLRFSSCPSDACVWEFNGHAIAAPSWWGWYPKNKPIQLTARKKAGYTFAGWRQNVLTMLVDKASDWRYLDDGSNQGTAWHEVQFSDSSWAVGQAPLGYSISGMNTKVSYGSNSSKKHITTYFRKHFQLEAVPSTLLSVQLNLWREDGAVVWLNGQKVVVSNLPEPFDYSTKAPYSCGGLAETTYLSFAIAPALLRQGDNVLAVEVHQCSASSSDLAFDLELCVEEPGTEAFLSTNETYDFTLKSPLCLTAVYQPTGESIVPETIDTDYTLYKSRSPYLVPHDVCVTATGHLRVEPGVELLFSPDVQITVNGMLTAEGLPTDSILFRLNPVYADSLSWGAISFLNTEGRTSTLRYVELRDASQGPRLYNCVAALSACHANLVLDHLRLTDVDRNPVAARYSDVRLTNSLLHSKVTGDLINIKYGTGYVAHCEFIGNDQVDTDAIDYDGVTGGIIHDVVAHDFLGSNSDAVDIGEQALNVQIDSLLVYNITDKGVSVGQRSSVSVTNSTFIQTDMGLGVKDSCSAVIDRCTFFAVATPVACYEKVLGRAGGNAVVSRSILSNSFNHTVLCDGKSTLVVTNSFSDNSPLPQGDGNRWGEVDFLSPGLFRLQLSETMQPQIGSTYLPQTLRPEPTIVEICYNPAGLSGEAEYLRLYNPSEETLDLNGYTLSEGITYTFPADCWIEAGGYLTVTKEAAALTQVQEPVYQWTKGSLSNEGETIRLSKPNGTIIDQVSYLPTAPWPVAPADSTVALKLNDELSDNHLAAHWSLVPYLNTAILSPALDGQEEVIQTFDLQGRKVDRPTKGIYLQQVKNSVTGRIYLKKRWF